MLSYSMNKAFWGELSKLGLKDVKEDIVCGISNGRTTSLKELHDTEVREWIGNIHKQEAMQGHVKDKLRKQMIAMAYSIGKDVEWLKEWIFKQGHKELNAYGVSELIKHREILKKVERHVIEKVYK